MAQECEPLIDSTSEGGLGAKHPAVPTQEMYVAPTDQADKNTVRAAIVPIACWRLDDLRFQFDSSFVLPDAATELTHLARLHRIHPDAPLLLFGHADPVGQDDYNKKLSGRRATAVYAILVRDLDLWDDLYRHPLGEDDWRKNDAVGFMAASLGKTEPVDESQDTVRRALYLEYMNKLCRDEKGEPFRLQKTDFLARGADPQGKGDYHGCGEFNPVLMFSAAENEAYNKTSDKSERNAANAPNRRVVVFLFRPGSKVSPGRWPCPPVSKGPAACKKRFWSDAKKRRQFQAERREFSKTFDTFACRFYERIARHSPCEAGVERSIPTLLVPEQPGSDTWIKAHSLWVYVARFAAGPAPEGVQRFSLKDGKLCDDDGKLQPLDCNRQAYFYFSHRRDLGENLDLFRTDGSGLPLLGPVCVPCGPDAEIDLDIWDQKDWAIVRGRQLDGMRPDNVLMAEWQDNYKTGQLLVDGRFRPGGHYTLKQSQEKWKGGKPIPLIPFGSPGGNPIWVGTLTALPSPPPTPRAKILVLHKDVYALTFNEIKPLGYNQFLEGHHVYNVELVTDLLAVAEKPDSGAAIDALPEPPARFVLPGDICWYDQGATNFCGAYSFAASMNYWWPYLNNSQERDGAWFASGDHVDSTIAGARTPQDLLDTAPRYKMFARRFTAEDIDKGHALKWMRLWIQAGIPILMLVEEYYGITSLHWKTVVGYEGNRFFMNNSGADDEEIKSHRAPGVDYEHAPNGNDVDAPDPFYNKWWAAGGNLLDWVFTTSIDRCTFVAMYPMDPMFVGAEPR